jgi:hypothetical protein
LKTIPDFVEAELSNPPRSGDGVHIWLFKMSRQLHVHLPACEIVALLEKAVAGCGRFVSRKEIEDAVKNSIPYAWQPKDSDAPAQSFQKWPKVNHEQCSAIIRDCGGLADLWEKSASRIDDNETHTEEIIDQLFPGNPLLCCGKSQSDFDAKPRQDWRGELARLQFIVPSPMSAVTGQTKDGRESKHTLDNTGARRFLVCEFDHGSADDQAALLLHLAKFAPLICAVHSGGKSLHGWFYVHGQPELKVEKFFRYAVSFGADRMTWTRSQFVRIPDGRRDNGVRQTVFFLNIKPIRNNP